MGQGTEIEGNIFLTTSNTLAVGTVQHEFSGQVSINNSVFEVSIKNVDEFGRIKADGISMQGSELKLDVSGALVKIGDQFEILEAGAWFGVNFSNGSIAFAGDNNEYEFSIEYVNNTVVLTALTAIPEPSTYSIGAVGLLAALALWKFRTKNRQKN